MDAVKPTYVKVSGEGYALSYLTDHVLSYKDVKAWLDSKMSDTALHLVPELREKVLKEIYALAKAEAKKAAKKPEATQEG